jgi:hypothetical protein
VVTSLKTNSQFFSLRLNQDAATKVLEVTDPSFNMIRFNGGFEMKVWSRLVSLALGLALSGGAATYAMAKEASVEPERCVQLSRVKSTEILSNHQVLFKMLDGKLYVNSLPYPCPGLRPEVPLLYRTSIDKVCNVDVVTVLEPLGGGFYPSGSCGLGKFEPVDKGEVAQLREAARTAKVAKAG